VERKGGHGGDEHAL
jgi:hypothetical protein